MTDEVKVAIAYSTAGLVVSCVGVFFAFKVYWHKKHNKWNIMKNAFC